MPTTITEKRAALPLGRPSNDPNREAVAHWVLDQLGTPKLLTRVDAERLWDNNYRVNIYCKDLTSRIAAMNMTDSFFVTLNGESMTSRPEIKRRYN